MTELDREVANAKARLRAAIAGTIVGLIGITLIWVHTSWHVAFAVFLTHFAHNLEWHSRGGR